MGRRPGYDDYIGPIESETDARDSRDPQFTDYYHTSAPQQPHMGYGYDNLITSDPVGSVDQIHNFPNRMDAIDRKDYGNKNVPSSMYGHMGHQIDGTEDEKHEVAALGNPAGIQEPLHQASSNSPLGLAFNESPWWNTGHFQSKSGMNSEATPAVPASTADPVINVVAPEEISLETKHYADDAFPMYTADGIPIQGSQVPEFQQHKEEVDSGAWPQDFSADPSSLTSPITPTGSNVPTPFGTPQASPLMTSGSPASAGSFGGSPLTADGSRSPYGMPFYTVNDGGLSPLIDDDDPLFESPGPFEYSRNNMLDVPSRKKSRSLSDTWSPYEKQALLDSLSAQSFAAGHHQPGTTFPLSNDTNHSTNSYLVPDAGRQPRYHRNYSSINLHGHMPNKLSAGGSSTSGESRANSTGSSGSSSATASPNGVLGSSHTENANESESSSQLVIPMSARARSFSSPYEHTGDLKSAQMFSCELCGKRFTRAYNLRSHMRTHTDERPFACQHCGKAFARQHDRKRHEALHSGEKRFVCYGLTQGFQWGCRKRFARADALGRHFRTEAGKNCLRPLINRICANGSYKETAPEGILFTGFIDDQPQLVLNSPDRDANTPLTPEEREEQRRRTVIATAVTEQFHELVDGPSRR